MLLCNVNVLMFITKHTAFTDIQNTCLDSEIQYSANRGPCMSHCGDAGKALHHYIHYISGL